MVDFVFYLRNAFRILTNSEFLYVKNPRFCPGLRPPGPAYFWIDSSTSLVSVWIRFAKISQVPSSLLNTKSTISQKLKIAQKKTHELKNPFQNIAHLETLYNKDMRGVSRLRICGPPPLRSDHLDIKDDAQCAKKNDGRETSYRVWALRPFIRCILGAQNFNFLQKWRNLQGRLELIIFTIETENCTYNHSSKNKNR